ncbi:hypothetical protein P9A06_19310 [Serratia marcescens]|uniref:hypothetical protein n=1 Tax=Serratia marcescens TaxID=615 RepID=UPI003204DA8A
MSIYAVGIALGVPTFRSRKVAIKNSIQLIENIEFYLRLTFSQHAVACRSLPTADLTLSPQNDDLSQSHF